MLDYYRFTFSCSPQSDVVFFILCLCLLCTSTLSQLSPSSWLNAEWTSHTHTHTCRLCHALAPWPIIFQALENPGGGRFRDSPWREHTNTHKAAELTHSHNQTKGCYNPTHFSRASKWVTFQLFPSVFLLHINIYNHFDKMVTSKYKTAAAGSERRW